MDEDAAGFKTANILPALNMNIFPEPETSHPKWNDWYLALDQSMLRASAMKGTLLCNWCDGPFGSGAHQNTLGDAAEIMMEKVPASHRENAAPAVAFDRADGSDGFISADEWVAECQKRLEKAGPIEIPTSLVVVKFGPPRPSTQ